MPDPRLELALVTLARRFAPELLPGAWEKPGDYPGPLGGLATALADHDVLVLAGDCDDAELSDRVRGWTDSYLRLYALLTGALFPSFADVAAYSVDTERPPIAFIHGAATPVLAVLARCVVPYVAARHGRGRPSDVELLGLMNIVLDELEARDLPHARQRQLADDGVAILRELLSSRVRQRRLTDPDLRLRTLVDADDGAGPASAAPPVSLPLPPSMPEDGNTPPPAVLPESGASARPVTLPADAPAPPPGLPLDLPAPPTTAPEPPAPSARARRRRHLPDMPDNA